MQKIELLAFGRSVTQLGSKPAGSKSLVERNTLFRGFLDTAGTRLESVQNAIG
jgi:hypothetical protein